MRKILRFICLLLVIYGIFVIGKRFYAEISFRNEFKEYKNMSLNLTIEDLKLDSLKKLHKEYEDVIGWIRVDDTNIDMPVVKGKDNSYFLNHNYKGEYHPFGALFLDKDNEIDFSNQNSVIYGHNIKTGYFFHDLMKFYENPNAIGKEIEVVNLNGINKYKIVAVFKVDPYEDYRKPEYENEKFKKYVEMIKRESKQEVNLSEDDSILTLSTCYKHTRRLVVVAKKIT